MTISDEIDAFVVEHRDHGPLTGDATEPGLNGYTVWITCLCGVEFRRLRHSIWQRWRSSTDRS
jgi:hypothetical protein